MTGFRDEKALWKYQKPRLKGKWDRYELITPSGHPDVKGSYKFRVIYIENKVGDYGTQKARLKAMEGVQVEYLNWLVGCGQECYVCFGGAKAKVITFYRWGNDSSALLIPMGPSWLGFWRA